VDGNSFEFTAIRGVQAGSAYYVIMVPLKVVPTLFKFDDAAMSADLRAQRVLNRTRVPAIASYIANNAGEYILSSLCASIDGEIAFEPVAAEGPMRKVGQLRIDMAATILINDGQHRRAAIEEAIRDRPTLGEETISVVVFPDRGLARSQQMFADLNIHAVKPTKSIKLLYNHRDALARLSREVVAEIPLFRDFTCYESSSISNRSTKLFTLSSLHQATVELIGKSRTGVIEPSDKSRAIEYWTEVIEHMPDWRRVGQREISAFELRRDTIHAHAVAVQAIARAGVQLLAEHPDDWKSRLAKLRTIDWSRANRALWENRALVAGKMNFSKNNVTLIANVIVEALGLALTPAAQALEELCAAPVAPRLKVAG
jgi:DNA sulfur modification protein DndB